MDQDEFEKFSIPNASYSQFPLDCKIDVPTNDEQCPFLLLHGINYALGYVLVQCSLRIDFLHVVCSPLPGLLIILPIAIKIYTNIHTRTD